MPPFPADSSAFWYLGEAARLDMGGRVIEALPVWEDEKWTVWLPMAGGGVRAMHPSEAKQTDYLAREAAHASDVSIPFLEFLWQRASLPEVVRVLQRVRRDVRNFATCLAKFDHYHSTRGALGIGASAFVETEIEYLFTLSRSIFDLLQEAIACIWQTVELTDPLAQKKKRRLPKSFGDVVLKGGSAVPAADIQSKFQLPPTLAESYAAVAQFFAEVRNFRDAVVHGGTSVELVFVTEKGFCIDPHHRPFNGFAIWEKDVFFNERIASLKPFLAHIVVGTIDACELLIAGLATQVAFPAELAPGYGVHMRGEHNAALIAAKLVSQGRASPWWLEAPGDLTATRGDGE